jgi:hypothetical protein
MQFTAIQFRKIEHLLNGSFISNLSPCLPVNGLPLTYKTP